MVPGQKRQYGAVVKVQAKGVIQAGLAPEPSTPELVFFHLASYPSEIRFADSNLVLSEIMTEFGHKFKIPDIVGLDLKHLQFKQYNDYYIIQFLLTYSFPYPRLN